jgi:hypothetical protein
VSCLAEVEGREMALDFKTFKETVYRANLRRDAIAIQDNAKSYMRFASVQYLSSFQTWLSLVFLVDSMDSKHKASGKLGHNLILIFKERRKI